MEIFGVHFTEGELASLGCIGAFVAFMIWIMVRSVGGTGGHDRWGR
jgi:hypothetical protein